MQRRISYQTEFNMQHFFFGYLSSFRDDYYSIIDLYTTSWQLIVFTYFTVLQVVVQLDI